MVYNFYINRNIKQILIYTTILKINTFLQILSSSHYVIDSNIVYILFFLNNAICKIPIFLLEEVRRESNFVSVKKNFENLLCILLLFILECVWKSKKIYKNIIISYTSYIPLFNSINSLLMFCIILFFLYDFYKKYDCNLSKKKGESKYILNMIFASFLITANIYSLLCNE